MRPSGHCSSPSGRPRQPITRAQKETPVSPSAQRATALGLVAVCLWSTSVGIMRATTEALGPTGAPAVLFTLAALLLLPGRTPLRELPRGYLVTGGALFVAYELCFVLAIGLARSRTEAIEVSMVNYLWPSLTVLLSTLAGGQRPSGVMAGGLALAFAGVIMAASPPEGVSLMRFFHNAAQNPLSYGLALTGAFVWAAYSTCTRFLARGGNGLWFFMLLSAIAFWGLHVVQHKPAPMAWSAGVVVQVGLATTAMTLAYAFWNQGMLNGNIRLLGLAANGTPLMSALFASLLLSTPLPHIFWLGAAFVAIGSALAALGAARGAGRPADGA